MVSNSNSNFGCSQLKIFWARPLQSSVKFLPFVERVTSWDSIISYVLFPAQRIIKNSDFSSTLAQQSFLLIHLVLRNSFLDKAVKTWSSTGRLVTRLAYLIMDSINTCEISHVMLSFFEANTYLHKFTIKIHGGAEKAYVFRN